MLSYFGARYYDKSLGRWIVPDPKSYPSDLRLNQPQSFNPYVYCWNNPLRYIDPDGKRILDKETNEPLKEQEMFEQSLMIFGRSLSEEGLTLPFYYKKSIWRYVFSPIKQGPQLDFGPTIQSSTGIKYHFLSVNVAAANLPMSMGELESPLGKTKEGEDILRISTGHGYMEWSIQLTGTKEQLNNYLKNEGHEIVVKKNKSTKGDNHYELKLIREKKEE